MWHARPGWFEEPEQSRQRMNLLEDRNKWVKLTMTPVAAKGRLVTEKPNSPRRLLAVTVTYRIMKRFGEGMTQCEIQEEYQFRPKQLALCITGQKYLGGTDRKALAKKRRVTDVEPEPSTSK